VDADGLLRIQGRKKDMINRGGMKIYPAELEDVLSAHPMVMEVAVVGSADSVLGERVRAVIVPKGRGLTADAVIAFCRERVADYKVPEIVTFRDQPLPRNANGKVLKQQLIEAVGQRAS